MGHKQRFFHCFLKILDKKGKKWRELLPDQYMLRNVFEAMMEKGQDSR
jgi:hypothetical protein